MKTIFSSIILTLFLVSTFHAQQDISKNKPNKGNTYNAQPKLIVGIVVDQMRYDYLTRFYTKYGDGGFKRMMNEGFNCKNNHFNYVPTYTGPGHASVYTGTTPKYHGIIGNNWYDKDLKKTVYCAGDDTVASIGTTDAAGKMSPRRMKTTTFGDENRLFTQMQGKTIGIALKDRGAILPAGHTANAAYWFHGANEGRWITSTYYMTEMPQWVQKFNVSNQAQSYIKEWNTLYDIATYTESGPDANVFEGGFNGKDGATFPYDLKAIKDKNGGFDIIKATPYGNSITTDFALAAIDGEALGTDEFTDVLAISYSSPDYVGHNFGVNSKEVQDTYLRLDKDLERLFNGLDAKVGKGNYTVFLTADHAAIEVPAYLQSVNIPAGYFNGRTFKDQLNAFMKTKYDAEDLIENVSNNQIFLNRTKLSEMDLDLDAVQKAIVNEIIAYEHIDKAYAGMSMSQTSFTTGIEQLIQNGYNQKRSGDVIYILDPAVISYSLTGSTHGSSFNYDTHVPLLFFGNGISQGSTYKRTNITDIAPTMSAILGISFPNASSGQPLDFVLE
ncbi:alkaline phosphatase family protein [Gelidibacter salicanalis]|uniref:glycerophosphocholine cholinephosphodiesterase n=1 Tax=Gelidibacter salicanalis TaxID=291193 RepID=A0A5C7AFJ4_9FLAO|nr:alkaline phosphatase PafA [Gelidibacter salicanalis]TXE07318.1 alkaline phosphatase family protein [Gelidibacter salicanalis]